MADSVIMNATGLANWIPVIWSQEVISAVENSLVTGALVDRGYEIFAKGGGNRVAVPNLTNLTAAAVNTGADLALHYVAEAVTNIDINKFFDVGVGVDDINQLQSNPKYFEKVKNKVAYALAKQIDTNCAALFSSFATNKVGTVNIALTEDELIDAYEKLNSANAPMADRAWIFDPESITDLLKLDYFVRMDYVPGSVVSQGFQGRSIFGAPVYVSTNLTNYDGFPHISGYFQREALALILQMPAKFEVARLPLQHTDALIGLTAFGVSAMRETFGVCINCRS